jgi:hypothetical protein
MAKIVIVPTTCDRGASEDNDGIEGSESVNISYEAIPSALIFASPTLRSSTTRFRT